MTDELDKIISQAIVGVWFFGIGLFLLMMYFKESLNKIFYYIVEIIVSLINIIPLWLSGITGILLGMYMIYKALKK